MTLLLFSTCYTNSCELLLEETESAKRHIVANIAPFLHTSKIQTFQFKTELMSANVIFGDLSLPKLHKSLGAK